MRNFVTVHIMHDHKTAPVNLVQLVEALRYKPEGRRFDSPWFHWIFSLTPSRLDRTMILESTRPLTEMSTRNISGGIKTAGAKGWQPYYLHLPIVRKSESLTLLQPSGSVQACIGIALLLPKFDKINILKIRVSILSLNFRRCFTFKVEDCNQWELHFPGICFPAGSRGNREESGRKRYAITMHLPKVTAGTILTYWVMFQRRNVNPSTPLQMGVDTWLSKILRSWGVLSLWGQIHKDHMTLSVDGGGNIGSLLSEREGGPSGLLY